MYFGVGAAFFQKISGPTVHWSLPHERKSWQKKQAVKLVEDKKLPTRYFPNLATQKLFLLMAYS